MASDQIAKNKRKLKKGASGKRHKKQKLAAQTPAFVGGDEQDDFPLDLEDADQNAPESEDVLEAPGGGSDDAEATGAAQGGVEGPEGAAVPPGDTSNAKKRRKKKLREQLKAKKASQRSWEEGKKVTAEICQASREVRAAWLWQSYSAVTGSSHIEQAGLEESCMAELGRGNGLEAQLCAAHHGWGARLADPQGHPNGSPLVILVASSAVAANDLAKLLPKLNKACKVAKLFAKHFKVEEQQQALQAACTNIATGTPNRMDKLADEGSLKLGRLQLIVLDVALDAKQRCLLDIPEVCKDMWTFFRKHLKPLTSSGKAKIALIDSSRLGQSPP